MRNYLLLRNNSETGPFTLAELTAQTLRPTDLIWITNESTAWKYPTELDTLQVHVATDTTVIEERRRQADEISTASKGIFVAFPSKQHLEQKPTVEATNPVVLNTRLHQPGETFEQHYEAVKNEAPFQFHKTFSKPHHALWIGCVFVGLLFAAALIKKIVDTYDANTSGITTAAVLPTTDRESKNAPEENMYQNALTTEVVPIDTTTMKPIKHERQKVDLKKLVRLEANDYQVGLLGGIKNLRLLVINKSAMVLDKVSFELQYLKPNGDVLKTESLALKSVAPKSSKSLAMPVSKRGVKIAYHITGIQSKQGSDALLHL